MKYLSETIAMNLPPDSQPSESLDSLCRQALAKQRLEAFDNIDVDRLLAPSPISSEQALWIGRHLMLNGKSLDAYHAGQKIVRLSHEHAAPIEAKHAS